MSSAECPEKALIAAVVGQAVRDLGMKRERDSAIRYLMSDDPRVFGFVWSCGVLGLSPDWARKRIFEGRPGWRFDSLSS